MVSIQDETYKILNYMEFWPFSSEVMTPKTQTEKTFLWGPFFFNFSVKFLISHKNHRENMVIFLEKKKVLQKKWDLYINEQFSFLYLFLKGHDPWNPNRKKFSVSTFLDKKFLIQKSPRFFYHLKKFFTPRTPSSKLLKTPEYSLSVTLFIF